jgi:hypothetical protein
MWPVSPEEGRDSPRLLGRPLVTCRGPRPRRASRRQAHIAAAALLPSKGKSFSALGKPTVSRLYSRGPRLRAPTHHPRTSLPPKQGSLPACRAGLWPDGIRTRWTTSRNFVIHRMSHSFPTSLAWSHPSYGSSRTGDSSSLNSPVPCCWSPTAPTRAASFGAWPLNRRFAPNWVTWRIGHRSIRANGRDCTITHRTI